MDIDQCGDVFGRLDATTTTTTTTNPTTATTPAPAPHQDRRQPPLTLARTNSNADNNSSSAEHGTDYVYFDQNDATNKRVRFPPSSPANPQPRTANLAPAPAPANPAPLVSSDTETQTNRSFPRSLFQQEAGPGNTINTFPSTRGECWSLELPTILREVSQSFNKDEAFSGHCEN